MKPIALAIITLLVLASTFAFLIRDLWLPGDENATIPPDMELSEFDKCIADGNPMMKSLPAQCAWPNGTVVVDPTMPEPPVADPVACTMDAKICPDGSAVGRVPPSCAFAPCPGDDFLACEAAGNPVMESYPRQCRWENGTTVTEVIPE
jgi:hypothetical protein